MKRLLALFSLALLPLAGQAQTAGNTITYSNGTGATCGTFTSFSLSSSGLSIVCATASQTAGTVAVTLSGSGTVTGAVGSTSVLNCTSGTCSYTDAAPPNTVVLTAAPSAGYTFSGWSGSCTGTGTCSLTTAAGGSSSVTASFTPVTAANYTLSVTVSGSGSVSGSLACSSGTCTSSLASGTSVSLTATPSNGYTFSGWSGACSGTSTCSVTMSQAQSVTATFVAASTQGCTTDRSVNVVAESQSWNRAHAIGATGEAYPLTVTSSSQIHKIFFEQASGAMDNKDIVISRCAGDFNTADAATPTCYMSGQAYPALYVNYGTRCKLDPGSYYLNVRPSAGAATSQGYLLDNTAY